MAVELFSHPVHLALLVDLKLLPDLQPTYSLPPRTKRIASVQIKSVAHDFGPALGSFSISCSAAGLKPCATNAIVMHPMHAA